MVYEALRFDLIVWRGVFRFGIEFSTFVALKQAIKNKPQILNPAPSVASTQFLRITQLLLGTPQRPPFMCSAISNHCTRSSAQLIN